MKKINPVTGLLFLLLWAMAFSLDTGLILLKSGKNYQYTYSEDPEQEQEQEDNMPADQEQEKEIKVDLDNHRLFCSSTARNHYLPRTLFTPFKRLFYSGNYLSVLEFPPEIS